MNDLKFAFRQLLKNPGFTFTAVLVLALGIMANTTVFSLINAALFQPLPVARPEELVALHVPQMASAFAGGHLPVLRAQTNALAGVAAYARQTLLARHGDAPLRLTVDYVSDSYFPLLGLVPQAGRLLDDSTRAVPAVVLGDRCWRREFNADPAVIGRLLTLNGQTVTILGVAPPEFVGLRPALAADLWAPLELRGQLEPGYDARQRLWTVFARLRPGVSAAAAAASLRAIEGEVLERWAVENGRHLGLAPAGRGFVLGGERGEFTQFIVPFLFTLGALVLAAACANLANLLLARALGRRRELAVRLAVGATRARLVRQLLAESLVLALAGGAAGLLLSLWGVQLLLSLLPRMNGLEILVPLDLRVLAFTLALATLTALACGLWPALQGTRLDLLTALKDETQGLTSRRRWWDARNAFLVGQVTASVVLLSTCLLLVRSLGQALRQDPGFDYGPCLYAQLWERDAVTAAAEHQRQLESLREAARQLPGVRHAALSYAAPLTMTTYSTQGSTRPGTESAAENRTVRQANLSPDFFRTLGVALKAGRDFNAQDTRTSLRVALVNETVAAQLWPAASPLGRKLYLTGQEDGVEVVGVVPDLKHDWHDRNHLAACVYLPLTQTTDYGRELIVRVAEGGHPSVALTEALAALVRQHDPGQASARLLRPYAEVAEISLLPQRAAAWLFATGAAIGLGLVSLGLYGVLSYHVAQRTRELGLRLALGARRRQVLGLVLRRGLMLCGLGVAAGLLLARGGAQLLRNLLVGVEPGDLLTPLLVAALMLLVALLACWLPARRASRVDPMVALRGE